MLNKCTTSNDNRQQCIFHKNTHTNEFKKKKYEKKKIEQYCDSNAVIVSNVTKQIFVFKFFHFDYIFS